MWCLSVCCYRYNSSNSHESKNNIIRLHYFYCHTHLTHSTAQHTYKQLLICSLQATTGGNEHCLVSQPNYSNYQAFLTLMKPGFATHQTSPIKGLINSTTMQSLQCEQ